ncbi:MAG TPA: hypothetical protein VEX41_04615 [Candidatus Eisenbacteria bacterium]|nr:hypothetical protein [Candidatus Eisenbacteria bacterium]
MDQDDRDDVDIERLLLAYADARLQPDPRSTARVRAVVLDAAAAPVAEPAIVAMPPPAQRVASRTSLRSLGRGRLRGRNPAPVSRWDDPLEAMPEALAVASPEALAVASPEALAVASPEALAVASPEGLADALPLQVRAEFTGRVRRAELIPVVDPPAPAQTGRWVRRGFAALLAAGLLLGGAVAVSAAPPDSPLYDTRLLLENLTLPAAASERAEARVAALHERIKEARGAANGKNGKAVAAALKAYRASVKDALKEAGDDPAVLASLYAALGLQLEALETISAENVGDAGGAVENALEDGQNAVTEIEKRGHGKPAGTPGRGPKG